MDIKKSGIVIITTPDLTGILFCELYSIYGHELFRTGH